MSTEAADATKPEQPKEATEKDEVAKEEVKMDEAKEDEEKEDEDIFLFTSESVNEGHPDKICDQVSDAILDACLAEDPESKVACETCTKTGMVMVFGEITTKANVDYDAVVRDACKQIGYDSADKGLDYKTMEVLNKLEEQSPDIGQGVHGMGTRQAAEELGAGDQ